MSDRFFLFLATGALLTGCAYGVDADDPEVDSTGQSSSALEVAAATAPAAADGASREPAKPQPDPWGGRVPGRKDTPADQVGVDPGKPQPDPWHSSTATTTSTTNSK